MRTPEEVIKILSMCVESGNCIECPLNGRSCGRKLLQESRDIILFLLDNNKPATEPSDPVQDRSFEDTKRSVMEKAARSEQVRRCFPETAQEPAEAPEPWTREKVLGDAKKFVCGERQQEYGGPEESFRLVADLWTPYVKAKIVPKGTFVSIEPEDVAVMMALLKVARLAHNPQYMDGWVDGCGYLSIGGEIAGKEAEP